MATLEIGGAGRLRVVQPKPRNSMSAPVSEQQARQVGEWRNIWYRSYPGGRDYCFTYAFTGGSWRVYINNSPNYGRRPAGSIESHRLDIDGRPHICWTQDITTLSEAQAVSALWADSTERYIATGRFEPPPRRPQPVDRSVLNGYPASGEASAVSAQSRMRAPAPAAPVQASPAQAQPHRSLWARVKDQLFNY